MLRTRVSAAAVALACLMYGCGGSSSTPTAPTPTGDSSPTSPSAPGGPASPTGSLFNGIAASSSDGKFGALAVSPNGERFGAATELNAAAQIVRVTGATFILPDGTSAVVFAGDDGLPARAVFGDVVALFSNYTSNTVDITAVTADGTVNLAERVAIDASKLAELRSLPSQLAASAARAGWNPALTDARGLSLALKIGGLIFSVASCGFGLAAFPATLGASAIIAAGACVGIIPNVVTLLVPQVDSAALEASGVLMSAIGCGGGDLFACAGAITVLLDKTMRDAEVILAARPTPTPTPPSTYDGRWSGSGTGRSAISTTARVDVTFEVSGNRIANFVAPWVIEQIEMQAPGVPGVCPGRSGASSLGISNASFMYAAADSVYSVNITGSFTSSTTVSGTARFERVGTAFPQCASATISWSGRKQ